jgi:molybdopterin-guanine dinucleotide biosynthesis protein A
MTACILSGGENKRFPYPKGFIELGGRRLIESTVETLSGIFDRVVISTNEPEKYFYLGAPMIGDIVRQRGPMTGILSALVSTDEQCVFFAACDMPFIKPELIRYIAGKGCGTDAVAPVWEGRPEPLLAVYSKNLIDALKEGISSGKRSLRDFLGGIDVLYISEEEVKAVDPEGRSFLNINTMDDLAGVSV